MQSLETGASLRSHMLSHSLRRCIGDVLKLVCALAQSEQSLGWMFRVCSINWYIRIQQFIFMQKKPIMPKEDNESPEQPAHWCSLICFCCRSHNHWVMQKRCACLVIAVWSEPLLPVMVVDLKNLQVQQTCPFWYCLSPKNANSLHVLVVEDTSTNYA